MSRPSTRQQCIDYCLRALGSDVITINVSDDQLQDRFDEAFQFFSEYHFDGMERVYLKYIVTQEDMNNGYIELSYNASVNNKFVSSPGASGQAEDHVPVTEVGATDTYVNIEQLISSVLQVFHFSNSTINMFDVRYQYALNDLYAFGAIEIAHYTITQQYLSILRQILSPEKTVRFSRKTNRLYIDMKWDREIKPGDYLIIEAWRVVDGRVYPEVYNDMFLKTYLTALIKRQWGSNLIKFGNMQLPGGNVFNGMDIYTQAVEEINEIQRTVQSKYEKPPEFLTG